MKNNKFVIFIIICILIFSAIILFYKNKSNSEKASSLKESRIQVTDSIKRKTAFNETTYIDNFDKGREETVLNRLKQDEEEWLVELSDFFSEIEIFTFNDYLQLRESFNDEYLKAFEEFNEAVKDKEYQPTEESVKMNKIKKQYNKTLLTMIGEENYKKFLKLKDDFNEKKFYSQKNKYYQPMDF